MAKTPPLSMVFLDAQTVDLEDIDLSSLKKQGDLKLFDRSPHEEVLTRSRGNAVVITNKCVFNRALLKNLPDLQLICVAATGYNNVDVEAARELKIAVTNAAAYSTSTVVEHTLMFLSALGHRLLEHHQAVLQRSWSASPQFTLLDFPYSDLAGKTLGIVGFGAIGKKVAQVAKVLGMKVMVAKVPGRKYPANPKRYPLEEVFKESDFISLHCVLSKETHHLINTKHLNLMKKTAYLLNLARGPVVHEWAVAEALQGGRLAGYAADVMEQEPPPPDHPFFQEALRNKVLLTPHVAWASRESRQRLINEIAANIAAFKKGKKRNRVD